MKNILLLLVVCVSFLLTGCWDRTEINDIALIMGIGLDQKNEKLVEITVEMSITKGLSGQGMEGGDGGAETMIRSGEGNTIADAISNLQEKIPREVFWGHAKTVVIGEKLAKKGIHEHLDFLSRHPQPRLRAQMFVSKGKAKDVMALTPLLEHSSSEVLRELAKSKLLMDVTLKDLLQMLSGDAGAAALPMVSILSPQKGQKPLQTIAYINRTAIFKKDKMVGQINDKLTRGVLWFRNEIKHATVTLRPEGGQGNVSCTLLRADIELIPKIEDGKWEMTVKSVTEDDVVLNDSKLNMMNPKIVKLLEQDLKKDLEERFTLTLQNVQKKKKADILGFADAFHRKYPKEWQKAKDHWDDIFPNIEVTFETKVYVRRPGMTTTQQGLPEKEVKKK